MVSKSPQYADARNAAISCGQDVHIAVTNVDSSVFVCVKLFEGFKHDVGSRLFSYVFALADGNFNVLVEKMAAKFLRGIIKFVADNGYFFVMCFQVFEHRYNAFIGKGGVKAVFLVMCFEEAINFFKTRISLALRHRSLDEFSNTVADELPYLLRVPLGYSKLP